MAVIGAFMVPHPPLLIPGVGCGKEQAAADTVKAYREAGKKIACLAPETVVIATPHSVMYTDYFHISPGDGARGISHSLERKRAGSVPAMTGK